MTFVIPNAGSAAFADQAELDAVDIEMMTVPYNGPTGVVGTGCAVTAQGTPDMTVAVAAGSVRIKGRKVTVAGGNVTITAANATNPRFDLITVNTSGTLAATAGTAAAEAEFPAIPANSIVLAAVKVPANDTAINSNQITPKQIRIPEPDYENIAWYGAVGDDSTDNTQALFDAHAALPQTTPFTGGAIVVPIGRFRVNGRILAEPTNVTASIGGAGGPTGTFFYAVAAFNAFGETIAVATNPTSLTLTNLTGAIAWTAVADCVGYCIYRGTSASTMFFLARVNGQASSSYNDTNADTPAGIVTPIVPSLGTTGSGGPLAAGTYYIGVTAYNSNGETPISPLASITISAGQSITVTITAPANAGGIVGYRVFVGTVNTAEGQYYAGPTTTTSFTYSGNLSDHMGQAFAFQPCGLPNKWDETGLGIAGNSARQHGVAPTVNLSRIGWHIWKKCVRIYGVAGQQATIGAGNGSLLIPNVANMTMIQIGDGTAINQQGACLENLNIDDYYSRGGTVGISVCGTNHCRFWNVSVRQCDVGWWFYRKGLGSDCAWNDLYGCHSSRCTRWEFRGGNCYGVNIHGGDFLKGGPTLQAGVFCLDRANCIYAFGTMIDGGVAIFGPPWGGGLAIDFNGIKTENCRIAVDLDSIGSDFQGRAIQIKGGIANTNVAAPTIGVVIRSPNVSNPRIQYTINENFSVGFVDKGLDSYIASSNFAPTRGVGRDVVYNIPKLDDEARVSNTTLANDKQMGFWMAANAKYRITGRIFFDTTAAADFKYAFTGPAGATLIRFDRTHAAAGATPTDLVTDVVYPASTALTGTGTDGGKVKFEAIVHNGATAGLFAFQWAQNTSNAGNTTVRAGSAIDYLTVS